MKPGNFRLSKATSVQQEHPIYEIVDDDRRTLLDITKTDGGVYEVCVVDSAGESRVVRLELLLELIPGGTTKT
jgi:hypothetical protein